MEFTHKVTVFTPTYNRAYILENLYRSLQRQTCTEFEWLIVDDGSSDGTEVLVDGWQRETNPFPIRYVKKDNGGKCRAINLGLQMARGELFFTVDSDDYLTDDAIEKVIRWEAELPKDGNFCGYVGNRGVTPDSTPNTILDCEYLDGDAFDLYGPVDGERAFIFYTEIHRQYLYPEFPGERFMTEAVTWNRMAHDGYKMRFYNDIIWIWEYKPDGLTRAGYKVFLDNPQGTGLFFKEQYAFLHRPLRKKLALWYGFACQNIGRCTPSQTAQYIGCPEWLVKTFLGIHAMQPNKRLQAMKEFLEKRGNTMASPSDYHIHISAKHRWLELNLKEVWQYRDLITLFTKRSFVVSYKQTILGPAWIFLTPLFSSIVHAFVFGGIAGISTEGVPGLLFYLCNNAIWAFFSTCLINNASTFTDNAGVFGKVYFPRLTTPISNVISSIIRFGIQMLLVMLFMTYFLMQGSLHPNWAMWLLIPVELIHLGLLGMGLGIIISSLTTKYRDLTVLVGFGVSLWMYATPVVYPLSTLADGWIKNLILANPVTPSVELMRYALLGAGSVHMGAYAISWAVTILVAVIGIMVFNKVERTFMDTV